MEPTVKPLFVGIDISLNNLDADIIDFDSKSYLNKNKSFRNSPSGLSELVSKVASIAKLNNFNKIIFGYEATGNYGYHLPFYLSSDKNLSSFEKQIFQINPKIIKNFRKAYSELPKTDGTDSTLIAERLKLGKIQPYLLFDPQCHSLRILTRQRFDIIQKIVSEKSRFISNMFIKASGFAQNRIFSNVFGATSAFFMTMFESVNDIADTPIKKIIDIVVEKSKNKIRNIKKIAETISYVARESYRPDRVIHDSINNSLIISYNHIKYLKSECNKLDDQITNAVSIFKNQYNILTSIKGIGPVFAAGIIAEIGDINLFSDQSQVAKYSGLIWRLKQSGKFKSEETALTKSGNKYLRYYLVQAAQSIVTHNPDFRKYYSKKLREAKKHKHKRAIVFVARKLIRVIFCLLKNNKLYVSPRVMTPTMPKA